MSTPTPTNQTEKPPRGIGSIAHYFLTPPGDESDTRPRRVPPSMKELSSDPLIEEIDPSDIVTPPLIDPMEADNPGISSASFRADKNRDDEASTGPAGSDRSLVAEIVIADHLSKPLEKIGYYARFLTRQDEKTALVKIDEYEAALQEPDDNGYYDPLDRVVIAETEDIPGALLPELIELTKTNDIVLITIDASFRSRAAQVINQCSWVTVLCTAESDCLIETYKTVKWLTDQVGWQESISLFVCDAPHKEAARKVFHRLAGTGRDFLNVELQLAGFSIKQTPHTPSSLEPENPVPETAIPKPQSPCPDSETKPAPETRTDSPADPTNQASAPTQAPPSQKESTPAMSTLPITDDDKNPESLRFPGNSFVPIEADPENEPAPRAQTHKPGLQVYNPITIAAPPRNDQQLADVLQLALPGWLASLPGAMAVPLPQPEAIDPAARILIDAGGRLHIMLAALSARENLLDRSLAARKWLAENMTLILYQCRQIQIDRTVGIGLVLIAGNDMAPLKTSCSQFPEIPTRLLQLHLLQTGQQWSLLTIPV